MKRRREQLLYDLSVRLGIEVYVLEVGKTTFLPEQSGTGGFVGTKKGATLEWMKAAIEQPEKALTWTHTHPQMAGFFSMTDEDGAHALFDMVRRPIHAVVLGTTRHTETITEEWVKEHPVRPPIRHLPARKWWGDAHYGRDFGYSDEWDGIYGSHNRPYQHDPKLDRWGRWKYNPKTGVYELNKDGERAMRLRRALNGLRNAYGVEPILDVLHDLGMIELLRRATPQRRRELLDEADKKEEGA